METASERRVLLIAYEFPPSAGGGVQRISKFAKHLPENGWLPQVLTGRPVSGRPIDAGLEAGVEGIPVERLASRHVATAVARALRPFKRAARRGASDTGGLPDAPARPPASSRISRWIASPDDAVLWARAVPAAARRMHRARPFDAILASGPPFSALVAAIRTGRELGLPVVLDMRDPWAGNAQAVWPTAWHARRAAALQAEASSGAAMVIAVSEEIADEAREFGASQVEVIPNGFDPEEMPPWAPDGTGPLRLAFLGRFYAGVADPTGLLEGIARARERSALPHDLRLEVVGPDAPWVRDAARRAGVEDAVVFLGFRPYREALGIVAGCDAGVLVIADVPGAAGVYSGKLFDYLGIGIPVLLHGPPSGAAANVVRESGCGAVVPYGDVEGVAKALVDMAEAKRTGSSSCTPAPAVRERFDRRRQVARVAAMLDRVALGGSGE